MRVAVCLFGNVGFNSDEKISANGVKIYDIYDSIRDCILCSDADVDFFVHSWSCEIENEIRFVFKPKAAIIEKQLPFQTNILNHLRLRNIADIKFWSYHGFKIKFQKEYLIALNKDIERYYSRWYSTKKVIELKESYERERRFQYDFVMLTRFDIVWFSRVVFSDFRPGFFYSGDSSDLLRLRHNYLIDSGCVDYCPRLRRKIRQPLVYYLRERLGLPKTVFWAQPNWKNAVLVKFFGWNQYNLSDGWFIGSNDVMNRFGRLYDTITEYSYSPHISAYEHACQVVGKRNLRFPFKQFVDYDLYRHSRLCKVQFPLVF